jgi:hypothetical protein
MVSSRVWVWACPGHVQAPDPELSRGQAGPPLGVQGCTGHEVNLRSVKFLAGEAYGARRGVADVEETAGRRSSAATSFRARREPAQTDDRYEPVKWQLSPFHHGTTSEQGPASIFQVAEVSLARNPRMCQSSLGKSGCLGQPGREKWVDLRGLEPLISSSSGTPIGHSSGFCSPCYPG